MINVGAGSNLLSEETQWPHGRREGVCPLTTGRLGYSQLFFFFFFLLSLFFLMNDMCLSDLGGITIAIEEKDLGAYEY